MSPLLLRALVPLAAVVLGACTPTHYKIILRDGREIIATGRPEFIAKTGYYRYPALNGKDALVRADEVLMLNEQ